MRTIAFYQKTRGCQKSRREMKKILRINMGTGHYRLVDSGHLYINLGGRALTSHIISEEIPPATDPLDPENRLIFAPGILAGTRVPNSGRLSVGAKSPLTHTIKEANVGGAAAQKLARLGIQTVVVEERVYRRKMVSSSDLRRMDSIVVFLFLSYKSPSFIFNSSQGKFLSIIKIKQRR